MDWSILKITVLLSYFLKFFENIKNFWIKYPERIKGIAKPAEQKNNNNIPLVKFSSVAANTQIDPRIGPMQGVHPNAKAIPIKIGLNKFLLKFVWILFS